MASIKPHFLYNTLDTIHWMARRYGANDIVEAVDALSDLFRVGFSANHELGTVETEFSHVESYLKIQKLRYHDILDYSLEMDPAVRHLPVMQTILQPIVENALYHGIKESGNPAGSTFRPWRENDPLLMVIRDNGRARRQHTRSASC
jgi:two-component system sensor histidine kinase YesM